MDHFKLLPVRILRGSEADPFRVQDKRLLLRHDVGQNRPATHNIGKNVSPGNRNKNRDKISKISQFFLSLIYSQYREFDSSQIFELISSTIWVNFLNK